MNLQAIGEREARFEAYVQVLASVIGYKDRAERLRGYCNGLLVETGRKGVEPMAAIDSAGEDIAATSIAAAFRGQRCVVRCSRFG